MGQNDRSQFFGGRTTVADMRYRCLIWLRGFSIVNLSSSAGLYGPPKPKNALCAPSKWGLIGLTKSRARGTRQKTYSSQCNFPRVRSKGERIDRIFAAEADLRVLIKNG
ncbi:MAG: hypothetical protein CM1200mP18_12470 [Gammaproteobacteria bacterium]|nr:MAG: hypothetical protein CM1200mP18_12470 [Gammaproteobacteria bacterium]